MIEVSRQLPETLARRRIPETHSVVEASAGQGAPIRAPGHAADRIGMTRQLVEALPCGRVPDAQCFIPTGRDQGPAVRAPRQATYGLGMARALDAFPRGDIPDSQR